MRLHKDYDVRIGQPYEGDFQERPDERKDKVLQLSSLQGYDDEPENQPDRYSVSWNALPESCL